MNIAIEMFETFTSREHERENRLTEKRENNRFFLATLKVESFVADIS